MAATRTGGVLLLLLLAPVAALAECPVDSTHSCTIVLHGKGAPRIAPDCLAPPWARYLHFTLPEKVSDSNQDGSWETVFELDLDPAKGCACLHFRVFYDEPGSGFSLNVGDSATNNGKGGDMGTTSFSAEAQIHDSSLAVYSAGSPSRSLLKLDVPQLAGRVVDLQVCDQLLRVAVDVVKGGERQFLAELDTHGRDDLFALSADPVTPADDRVRRDYLLYAAFNRVIAFRNGAPSHQRLGRGVSRVEVYLTP